MEFTESFNLKSMANHSMHKQKKKSAGHYHVPCYAGNRDYFFQCLCDLVLGLSARIGTLTVARSVIHDTVSRFTVCGTVPCRGIQASFSTAHAYRQLQTDSMRKNNIVRGVQTKRRHFFVCYRPSRQT